jgi:hypothetical protein
MEEQRGLSEKRRRIEEDEDRGKERKIEEERGEESKTDRGRKRRER